jgi:hypothetical protein
MAKACIAPDYIITTKSFAPEQVQTTIYTTDKQFLAPILLIFSDS